jgi:hypothetical protein
MAAWPSGKHNAFTGQGRFTRMSSPRQQKRAKSKLVAAVLSRSSSSTRWPTPLLACFLQPPFSFLQLLFFFLSLSASIEKRGA